MLIRALRITISAVVTAVVCAILIASCFDSPPRTDWPPDDIGADIGDCCNGIVLPGIFDDPQECIDERTNVEALQHTQCRFIHCLGGIVTYYVCNCHGAASSEPCP